MVKGLRRRSAAEVDRSAFAGFRFPTDVIVVAVRWYLRYGLSYRNVEELLAERGIEVDHVSIYRWGPAVHAAVGRGGDPCPRGQAGKGGAEADRQCPRKMSRNYCAHWSDGPKPGHIRKVLPFPNGTKLVVQRRNVRDQRLQAPARTSQSGRSGQGGRLGETPRHSHGHRPRVEHIHRAGRMRSVVPAGDGDVRFAGAQLLLSQLRTGRDQGL